MKKALSILAVLILVLSLMSVATFTASAERTVIYKFTFENGGDTILKTYNRSSGVYTSVGKIVSFGGSGNHALCYPLNSTTHTGAGVHPYIWPEGIDEILAAQGNLGAGETYELTIDIACTGNTSGSYMYPFMLCNAERNKQNYFDNVRPNFSPSSYFKTCTFTLSSLSNGAPQPGQRSGGIAFVDELTLDEGAYVYIDNVTLVKNGTWKPISDDVRVTYHDGTPAEGSVSGNSTTTLTTVTTSSSVPTSSENKCGQSLTWQYDSSTHTLTISGTGEMYNYNETDKKAPWSNMSDSIQNVIVSDGVTYLGENAFNGCGALTKVNVPISVTHIGKGAFEGCDKLKTLYYAGTSTKRRTISVESGNESILNALWICQGVSQNDPGDANGDGSVDMKDVLVVRKFIAGLGGTIDDTAADVNYDFSVDMKDVLLMRKFIAGLILSLEKSANPAGPENDSRWNAAMKLYNEGKYPQAAWAFGALTEFSEAKDMQKKAESAWRQSLATIAVDNTRFGYLLQDFTDDLNVYDYIVYYYIDANGSVKPFALDKGAIDGATPANNGLTSNEHGKIVSIGSGQRLRALYEDGFVANFSQYYNNDGTRTYQNSSLIDNIIQITPIFSDRGVGLKADGTVLCSSAGDYEIDDWLKGTSSWKNITSLEWGIWHETVMQGAILVGLDSDGVPHVVYQDNSYEKSLQLQKVAAWLSSLKNIKKVSIYLSPDAVSVGALDKSGNWYTYTKDTQYNGESYKMPADADTVDFEMHEYRVGAGRVSSVAITITESQQLAMMWSDKTIMENVVYLDQDFIKTAGGNVFYYWFDGPTLTLFDQSGRYTYIENSDLY